MLGILLALHPDKAADPRGEPLRTELLEAALTPPVLAGDAYGDVGHIEGLDVEDLEDGEEEEGSVYETEEEGEEEEEEGGDQE